MLVCTSFGCHLRWLAPACTGLHWPGLHRYCALYLEVWRKILRMYVPSGLRVRPSASLPVRWSAWSAWSAGLPDCCWLLPAYVGGVCDEV